MRNVIYTTCLLFVIFVDCVIFGNEKYQGEVTLLVEELLQKKKIPPMPPEIKSLMFRKMTSSERKAHSEYYKKRDKLLKQRKTEQDKIRHMIANYGDRAIGIIFNYYENGNLLSDAPLILRYINTSEAKHFLLRMSLGDTRRFEEDELAARNYLDIANGPDEAEKLLIVKSANILKLTLQKFPSIPVEGVLLDRLKILLQSNKVTERITASNIMIASKSVGDVPGQVHALIESLHTIQAIQNSTDRFSQHKLGTNLSQGYLALTKALSQIKGAGVLNNIITQSGNLIGVSQASVVVARAFRGDPTVKDELYTVLMNSEMIKHTDLRLMGLQALSYHGTFEDIAFLQKIAESDEVKVLYKPNSSTVLEIFDEEVVNNKGEYSFSKNGDPFASGIWDKSQVNYPIRIMAKHAIMKIQERIDETR